MDKLKRLFDLITRLYNERKAVTITIYIDKNGGIAKPTVSYKADI